MSQYSTPTSTLPQTPPNRDTQMRNERKMTMRKIIVLNVDKSPGKSLENYH